MTITVLSARVYRFHDMVAVSFRTTDQTTKTIYLDPDMAIDLETLIHDAANDIYNQPKFSKSTLGTFSAVACGTSSGSRIEKG